MALLATIIKYKCSTLGQTNNDEILDLYQFPMLNQ